MKVQKNKTLVSKQTKWWTLLLIVFSIGILSSCASTYTKNGVIHHRNCK